MTPAGFPHSDIPGSQLGCQLPRAYRRLLRPSSALDAKASTVCPSQLATTNTTPHRSTPATPQKGAQAQHGHSTATLTAAHYKDARVHYPDLKQQPHTTHTHGTTHVHGAAGNLKPQAHQPATPTTTPPPPSNRWRGP